MSQGTETPPTPYYQVPGAVHEATRSLLRLRTGGDARRVAEHLVREPGSQLVPAGRDDPSGLEALRPVVEAVDTGAALLLDLGRQGLLDGPRPSPGSDVARVSSDRTA
jgi:hypothetical protein